jgi:hypothetical protein
MMRNADLWERLQRFSPDDPGAAFRFSHRLARENGWKRDFAQRAIEEYKKFLYLACVGDRAATPSDIVDQVWHLHLTYTRSYWDDLCGEVLKRPLHHGPTKGGASEAVRYREQYAATLALYRAEFGYAPPPAFWPEADARFSAAHQRWVDARTHFVFRKPNAGPWLWGAIAAAFAGTATTSAAQSAEAMLAGLQVDHGLEALFGVVTIAVIFMFIVRLIDGGGNGRGGRGWDFSVGSDQDADGDGGDGGGGCGGGGCGGD